METTLFYARAACDTMMHKFAVADLPPKGHFYYHIKPPVSLVDFLGKPAKSANNCGAWHSARPGDRTTIVEYGMIQF